MLNIAHCYRLGFAIGKVTRTNKSSTAIVLTLRRGNAAVDAPASRNAGPFRTEFPRRSVGTIKLMPPNNRMAQKLPSMALDSVIPAGMTSFGYSHRLVYKDERRSGGAIRVGGVCIASYLRKGVIDE